jgi:hypothetical protein
VTSRTPTPQIWVYGDSYQAKLVAIVVPKPHALQDWAKAQGKSGEGRRTTLGPAAAVCLHRCSIPATSAAAARRVPAACAALKNPAIDNCW